MRYLLDTNIVSEIIRRPHGLAADRVRSAAEAAFVSVVVAAELRYGCLRKASAQLTQRVEQFLAHLPVLPFAEPADRHYAAIRTELEARGQPIGQNDLLIAAHALALDATLVTANEGEFRRVNGLKVENWMVSQA